MIQSIIKWTLIAGIIYGAYTETGVWTAVNLIGIWVAHEIHWSAHRVMWGKTTRGGKS